MYSFADCYNNASVYRNKQTSCHGIPYRLSIKREKFASAATNYS